MSEKICGAVILAIIYLLLAWKASDMSTVNNVISNVMPIIWAAIALLEWMAAEEKEDKIYAAVMMILAMITRR